MLFSHLHFLIDEELYRLDDTTSDVQEKTKNQEENEESNNTNEPYVETLNINKKYVDFIVFYELQTPEELDLLNKIVVACRSDKTQIKLCPDVEKEKEYTYKKAIIFTEHTSTFYKIIKNENNSLVVYAHPLSVLQNSKEDKKKLWKVIQVFI